MKMFGQFMGRLLLGLIILLFSHTAAFALTITWSGSSIEGERHDFLPSGSAEFNLISSGTQLQIILTNNTTQETLAIGEVLTGLTWDITDSSVILTPVSALIAPGSRLVGANTPSGTVTDLSGEWGFKDNISAGLGPSGPIGSFGIGAVGDINNGADTFGVNDRFNTAMNLFGPSSGSLNGIDAGIVGSNVNFSSGGFGTHGPMVQEFDGINPAPGEMLFLFNISGSTLEYSEIANVQPIFGTDGAVLVSEPSTLLLFCSSLGVFAALRKLRYTI